MNTAVVVMVIARGDHSRGMRVASINQFRGTLTTLAIIMFANASRRAGINLFILYHYKGTEWVVKP